MPDIHDIHKVGLLLIENNRVLLCRKRHGTQLLILPGGKPDPGESPLACLERELREELGDVTLDAPHFLGAWSAPAAGAPDETTTVHIDLYTGTLRGTPRPQAEISELIWFGEDDDWRQLAPSISRHILPDVIRRGILSWRPR